MDEIINISVNGYSLTKDSNVAGTQGDCNSTKLRITFAENWSEYAKSITFWNALGENPVKRQLGTDLLEDILTSYDVYLVPIPGEAMTDEGINSFVIEGSIDGKVKRSVEGKLKVLYSPSADNAGNPESVTPDLATQIRAEIDAVKGDIAEAKRAEGYAGEAENYSVEAKAAMNLAHDARIAIEGMTVSAETLEPNEEASVEKAYKGNILNMHFGIPAGESGVYMGAEEPTDPNVKVWLDTSGGADEVLTAKRVIVDGVEIYRDDDGVLTIYRPAFEDSLESELKMYFDGIFFNGMEMYHTGNLFDLKQPGNVLDDFSKSIFMHNTGLDARLGGIEANISTLGSMLGEMDAAIDEILAAQEAYIASNDPPHTTTEGGDGE